MEDKRYQIFISSTYRDLVSAREKVIGTILGLYHFPVGMEMFSADDDEQWEIIRETISVSDYYVLIIGHRYGSETSDGISYTEKEYDYAKENEIPIYAFIRQRNVATKPDERDSEQEKVEKLSKFIDKATASKMCDFWANEDELATKIAIALPKAFRRNPRIGWIRADKAMTVEVSNEIASLSKENRDLRKEIEIISAQLTNKRPEIVISLNDGEKSMFLKKKILRTKLRELENSPKEFEEKEIPDHLNDYISIDDIEKYNACLPSGEEIEKYNESLRNFLIVKKGSQPLTICVNNNGSSKANDVFIELEFPVEFLVMEKEEAKSISFPKNPMPQSLIDKAQKEYERDEERKRNPLKFTMGYTDFSRIQVPGMRSLESVMRGLHKTSDYYTSNHNKITIKINSLLHTRTRIFDEFMIVPMEAGIFEVKATVICEEYEQAHSFTIAVNVIDEQ